MTLPRGYKPPKEKEISASKDFRNNSNYITNKKEKSLTNEKLQSISVDDSINEVIEKGKEVVANLEETVKGAVKKGKDAIVGDSSITDKSLRSENEYNRSQLTQEKNMNNNKNYNHSDNSNFGINTDKSSSSISTKEELTAPAPPISTTQQEGETKIMLDNKEKEQYKDQMSPSITANTAPLEEVKEKTNKFLDNQTQQIKNKTSTISETTNKIDDNINQNQDICKTYMEKNISAVNKLQQETTTKTSQSMFNNYIELQKNITNTSQFAFSRFLDNTSKLYYNYFQYPHRYIDTYKNSNQTISDNAINFTQRVNDAALIYTENFTKSIEIAQKYYNNSVQNYFDFLKKIERCIL